MKSKTAKKHTIRNIILIVLAILAALVIGIIIYLKQILNPNFPELSGAPEVGKWYKISPDGTLSSDGSEWHGLMKLGTENKVMVYFHGGGVSLNEEMSKNTPEWFYIPTASAQDFYAKGGIFSNDEENPFKDWTFVIVSYSTGDFHTGQGQIQYVDDDGNEKTVYHNGYNNYSAFLDEIIQYLGEPDTLVVAGSSAGGFATALLSDDVISRFPSASNITVCVDSSLLYYDGWKETSETIWKSPTEISQKLVSDNIVLDSLLDLAAKRGSDIKILFACSVRDKDLQRYQSYIDNGNMEESKENSLKFQNGLKKMVFDMQSNLYNPGFYIFETGINNKTTSTQHMIMIYNVFDPLNGNKSVAQWLMDAVNGDIRSYGLDLLDNE